ncbi:MAG: hypothetical protein CL420_02830, partial [Acidimicrobiaceae bacterium]|nr:hypothetical protein [Acidimicrobiaceae bacterium]
EIEVVVEDVDPNGKISLNLSEGNENQDDDQQDSQVIDEVEESEPEASEPEELDEDFDDDDENYNLSDDYEDEQDEVKEASFEEAFAAELESVHGDLGPESHRNKGRRRKGGR